MKKSVKIWTTTLLACLAFGCTDDVKYREISVSPIASLNLPAADYFVELRSGTGRQVEFSWASAAAEDGMAVQYELLFFDAPSGGKQVAVVDVGLSASMILTHKELNKIMGYGGTASGQTGVLYWTVRASRGGVSTLYEGAARPINAKRMIGFDDIPTELYITGPASETGDDLEIARPFKLISAPGEEGEFEIYTQIGAGTFNFVSDRGGSRTFGIENDLLEEITDGIALEEGIYRMVVDFTVKSLTLTKLSAVEYVYPQNRAQNAALNYIGGGRWHLDNLQLEFARPGWGTRGFEERYRFETTTVDGTVVFGPFDASIDGPPADLNFDTNNYFTVVPRPYTGSFDPKWKWHSDAIPRLNAVGGTESNPWKVINLTLDMSNDTGRYFHEYTVLP